jgi:hypothetical protein
MDKPDGTYKRFCLRRSDGTLNFPTGQSSGRCVLTLSQHPLI